MNDEATQTPEAPASEASAPVAARKSPWAKRILIGGVAAVAIAGAGVAAMASGNDGWGPGHRMGGRFMHGFMEYQAEQVMTEIGASAEQKDKLKALITSTINEVKPGMGKGMEMREEITKLLTAPTIDRAAIETLRAGKVAEMDAKSKVVAKAVADAAELLTPDQRKKLADVMQDFGPGMHGRW